MSGPADPDLERRFQAALDGDAAAAQATAAPPPRTPWLLEDGSPRWGLKGDGTPRRSPPGPGRPGRDDKPRTQADEPPAPPPSTSSAAGGAGADGAEDYTEALRDTGLAIWLGLSAVPGLGGHAALWHGQVDAMAVAWNGAAQKNAQVRARVRKLSGEGGWTWAIPVASSTIPLIFGSLALLRDADARKAAAQANATMFGEYMTNLLASLSQDGSSGQPEQQPATVTPAVILTPDPADPDTFGA